jgi:hypothetical protein
MFMLQGLVDWIAWGFRCFFFNIRVTISITAMNTLPVPARYLLTILSSDPTGQYLSVFGFLKSWKNMPAFLAGAGLSCISQLFPQ